MDKETQKAKMWKKLLTIIKLMVLIGIIVGIPTYILVFQRDLISHFKSYNDVVNYIKLYKAESVFVYIGAQILQIIISILPGEVFQFAAGSIFGFPLGLLYSIIGAILGSTITYYLARFLGRDAMELIFGKQKTKYFVERLNSEKAYILVFLIYLIPGMPKDLVCYAAGISNLKFKPFIILSTIGRTPAMCGSLLFGVMYMNKSYTGIIVIGSICAIILLLCFIFRRHLNGILDKIYHKIS